MPAGYVYITIFDTGYFYVGMSSKAFKDNLTYRGSGIDLLKYIESHPDEEKETILLEECYSTRQLEVAEAYFIKALDAVNNPYGLNRSWGVPSYKKYVDNFILK